MSNRDSDKAMHCPSCNGTELRKNGHRRGRQCYQCKQCGRQFLESYLPWEYSNEVKALCLRMHSNGMSLRSIERATNIHNTTILHWLREAGFNTSEDPDPSKEITQQPVPND